MIFPRVYNKQTIQEIRNKRLYVEGSPVYEVTISDLSASAQKVYGFSDDSNIRKFLPLNFLRIVNKGGTDLKVYVGQKTYGEIILDDTIYTHYGDFYSFNLVNQSTSTTATGDDIHVTVQRKPGG